MAQEWVYWCVMQGKEERDVVRQFLQQLIKADTVQTYARIIKARIPIIIKEPIQITYKTGATHSDTHSDKINPIKRKGDLSQFGRGGVEVAVLST